jgi:type IV pilus assembly protein PilN
MIKINLATEGRAVARKTKSKQAMGMGDTSMAEILFLGIFLLGALVTVGTWYYHKSQLADRKAEVAEANREVEALRPVLQEVEDFKRKAAELERKINVIEELRENQRGPVHVMDQVSRALPELLWLDHMQLRGRTVEIRGRAFNTNQVATFIENLNRIPEFQEPRFREAAQRQGGIYQFTLEFNFSIPKPEPPPTAPPTAG